MIEARGLTKVFDTVTAVDGVDLDVAPRQIVGLVGINGAGKTTFLRMLAGILQPSAGSVAIAGHALDGDSPGARALLGFVPDTPMLFDALTVYEHLLFVAELYRVEQAAAGMDALLAEFALEPKRHATAGSLSRGMRQKLAICCAFLHEPPALLLDEPLSGLDPQGRRNMCDAITARAEAGSAVLVSSHELEVVERLCQRCVIIHQGRVRWVGSMDDARRQVREGGSLEDFFLHATGREGQAPPAAET